METYTDLEVEDMRVFTLMEQGTPRFEQARRRLRELSRERFFELLKDQIFSDIETGEVEWIYTGVAGSSRDG